MPDDSSDHGRLGESSPRNGESADSTTIEDLVAECVARVEESGVGAIEDVCREHPDRAAALRRALAPLREAGLLAPAPEPSLPPPPETSRRLGEYVIRREIGRGGMGVVYEAEQTSLRRIVALKVLPAHLTLSRVSIERFRREASLAAKLKHEGIVEVYSVGEEAGSHYFAMEFVRGTPLDRLIERIRESPVGRLDGAPPRRSPNSAWDRGYIETVVRLVARVADALQHAHDNGVVHRDVKPSNIILRDDGTPVLTDFGLARGQGLPAVTLTGDFAGTPHYVSPEQALATDKEIDRRSDVFSLGVTLYELLTLRRPFEGKTVADILSKIVSKSPVAPQKINPEIARDLETICLTAMEKSPDKRYASAGEMAADLRRFLEWRPVKARPVGWATRTGRWARRNPIVASLSALVAALVLTIAVGASISAVDFRKQRDTAVESLWNSLLERARAARWSGRVGRRADALAALAEAARIRPSRELRDEAIACLALLDLSPLASLPSTRELGYAFDADVERCAIGDGLGNISIRRVRDGAEIRRLEGFGSPVWSMRFSPTGRYLSAVFHPHSRIDQKELRVFDCETGSTVLRKETASQFPSYDFGSDGRSISAVMSDGSVIEFALDQARAPRTVRTVPGLEGLIFSPDGRRIAASRAGGKIVDIVRSEDWSVERRLTLPSGTYPPEWSADGRYLALPSSDYVTYVFDTREDSAPLAFRGHEAEVIGASFSPMADLLATVSWDDSARIFDVRTSACLMSLPATSYHVRISRDGRRLGISTTQARLEAWEFVGQGEKRVLYGHEGPGKGPWNVDYSADGRWFASAGDDAVRLWDAERGVELGCLPLPGSFDVAFHPGGGRLYTSGDTGLLEWPIEPDSEAAATESASRVRPPRRLPVPSPTGSLAISPDGTKLAVAARDDRVYTIDLSDGGATPRAYPGRFATRLSFSPNGGLLALGTGGSTEHDHGALIDLSKPAPEPLWLPGEDSRVAFSPDGTLLVVSDWSRYIVLETGAFTVRHSIAIEDGTKSPPVAFSRDGSMLAVVRRRTSIDLLDTRSFERIATLEDTGAPGFFDFRFSPDGTKLAVAVAGLKRTAALWDLRAIRGHLRSMGLDWDPPLPPAPPEPAAPSRVRVIEK